MPTVNIQTSAYNGVWSGKNTMYSTTYTNLHLPHDDNTSYVHGGLPNAGGIWEAGLNRPEAASSTSGGILYTRGWKSASYGGAMYGYLFADTVQQGTNTTHNTDNTWDTKTLSHLLTAAELPTCICRLSCYNANPTDVRMTTWYYNVTYEPVGGCFIEFMCWCAGLISQLGAALDMTHMNGIAAYVRQSRHVSGLGSPGDRILLPHEFAAALRDLREWRRPAFCFHAKEKPRLSGALLLPAA